jgi:transcriptional regulator with XRE-family HTH domain
MAKSLREHRAAMGWTQAFLASKSGVHPISISKYEKGQTNPSSRNLRRIADALGVTVDAIQLPDDVQQRAVA